jgi:hypothetical protein
MRWISNNNKFYSEHHTIRIFNNNYKCHQYKIAARNQGNLDDRLTKSFRIESDSHRWNDPVPKTLETLLPLIKFID